MVPKRPSASLLRKLNSHDPIPGVYADIVMGSYMCVEIVFELDDKRVEENAWLFVLACERVAGMLDTYNFCPFRSFVLKFAAAAEMVSGRPPSKREREAEETDFPF